MIKNINKNIIALFRSSLIPLFPTHHLQKSRNIKKMDQQEPHYQQELDLSKYHFEEPCSSSLNSNIIQNGRISHQMNMKTKYMFGNKTKKFIPIQGFQQGNTITNAFMTNEERNNNNQMIKLDANRRIAQEKLTFSKKNSIQTFLKIKGWRQIHQAPVDTMGCASLHETFQPIQIQKYQILIALMLSIQTKDEINAKVMKRLKQYGLTPQSIAKTSQDKLLGMIRESNFNKRKAKNILEVSKTILQKGLPKSKEEVLNYPGVGMKIAMLYLKVAQGITQGIGVDTHVHRISNKLGWVNTKNPNQTEEKLQKLFPRQYWSDININLVGFGQILCDAKKPKCHGCPVKKECPSSVYEQMF